MAGIASGAGVVGIGSGVGVGTSTASAAATTSATTAPGVVPPPNDMIGVLQSLATLISAQPIGEMRSTNALESCVQKIGRFVGHEVSLYLRLSELKREFERRYSQLPLRERLTLDTRRTELFLRAANDVSTHRLCFMLADRAVEGGITSDWLRVDEAVSVLTNQRRTVGVHYVAPSEFPRVVEPCVEFPPRVVPHVPLMALPIAPVAMPAQPSPKMVPQQPIAAPLLAAIPVAVRDNNLLVTETSRMLLMTSLVNCES
ncbi:hypothetical protein R1sor_007050 [Riccia sorocarpa]|uniref:Uncharacterized protein n=1 Tax=Riccia sorocarpa TaxID=122646 RepID=A0ABD3HS48_9MARC